jgi:hypothetical protein
MSTFFILPSFYVFNVFYYFSNVFFYIYAVNSILVQ